MKLKIKLTIVLVLLISQGFCQFNEIGLIPFKIEKNTETQWNYFEPKFTSGIYYNRSFKQLFWTNELVFAENEIHDFCRNCYDATSGIGVYKEMSFASGLGYKLHGHKKQQYFGLKGDIRLLAYVARTSYTGRFFGGIFPSYSYKDNHFYLFGAQMQYSLSYHLKSGLVFGLDSAVKFSKTRARTGMYPPTSSYIPSTVSMLTFPAIRIGYRFSKMD